MAMFENEQKHPGFVPQTAFIKERFTDKLVEVTFYIDPVFLECHPELVTDKNMPPIPDTPTTSNP